MACAIREREGGPCRRLAGPISSLGGEPRRHRDLSSGLGSAKEKEDGGQGVRGRECCMCKLCSVPRVTWQGWEHSWCRQE